MRLFAHFSAVTVIQLVGPNPSRNVFGLNIIQQTTNKLIYISRNETRPFFPINNTLITPTKINDNM